MPINTHTEPRDTSRLHIIGTGILGSVVAALAVVGLVVIA